MKRSALILALSLLVTASYAIQFIEPESLDCRKTVSNRDLQLPIAELIKQGLTNGTWTHSDDSGNSCNYQFREGGIVPTEKGIQSGILLNHVPLEKEARINQLKANLTGEWTNVTYGVEDTDQTFQNIRFKPDGTFSMVSLKGVLCKGSWEISRDTKFLILYKEKGLGKNEERTLIARIKNADNHSLVLNQIAGSDEHCLASKTFTFIK